MNDFNITTVELFMTLKLFKKIGKESIKSFLQESDSLVETIKLMAKGVDELSDDDYINVSMGALDLAMFIIENIDKCENEIITLLASATQKEVKEIKEMDGALFIELVVSFIKNCKDLFTRAFALLK